MAKRTKAAGAKNRSTKLSARALQSAFLQGPIMASGRASLEGIVEGFLIAAKVKATEAEACTNVINVGGKDYHRSTGTGFTNCLYPCGNKPGP